MNAHQILLLGGCLLAALLVACGSNESPTTGGSGNPNDGPSGLTVEGNAKGWDGGEAFVKAVISDRFVVRTIAQGPISASGDFSLSLPNDPYLESFGSLACDNSEEDDLVSNPDSLIVGLVRNFGVTESERDDAYEIGQVAYAIGDLLGYGGFTSVVYVFATSKGTVTGSCMNRDGVGIDTFDLNLQAGWNQATLVFGITDEGKYLTAIRSGDSYSNLTWVYNAYPPSPNDGPTPP